jgi:ATP-binding cassette subfamily C protein
VIDPVSAEGATTKVLEAYQAVPLLEPGVGWRIDGGRVDLFAVAAGHGRPGVRRFLFTASGGDVVFALSGGAHALLVVPLEPTCVSPAALGEKDPVAARAAVDAWGARLGAALGGGPTVPPTPADSAIEALTVWRHWASDRLAALEDLDARRHVERRASHRELSARAVRGAVRRLLAVASGWADEEPAPDGSPLFQAVTAVGHRLGLEVRSPDRAEAEVDEFAAIQRRSRIHVRQVLLREAWWTRDNGPLLGRLLADGRPVALLPHGPRRYELFDPASGTRTRVDAGRAATLAPIAQSLYPRVPAGAVSPFAFVGFGLRGRARDVLVIVVCGVLATLLSMVVAPATALLLDVAIPDADRDLVAQLGFGLLAAALGRTLFDVTEAFASMRVETAAASRTQSGIWARVLELRLPFLRSFSTGDLHARIAAVDGMRERISAASLRAMFAGVVSLLNVSLLFWYSSWMAWWALSLLALVAALTVTAGFATFRPQTRLQQLGGASLGLTMQIVQNVAKLRVAAAEGRAFERWSALYAEQQRTVRQIQRVQDLVAIVLFVLPGLALALLFALASGAQSVARGGGLTPGTFLAFNAAFGALIGGVTRLSGTAMESLDVINLWRRTRPLLDAEPEVHESHVQPGRLRGDVALTQVTFRYREDGPPVLNRVSLRAAPGEFIALVGPSGGGKSTILRMLLGFLTPDAGLVSYDGRDLAGLDVRAVRRQLGVVLQQSRVMAASIFENIAAGAPITLGEAWEAARQAGFAADIESFPMSMHTFVIEGGTNFSGGQRQRLLIARALAMKPRVLILDEATSALDNQTQAIVSRSLEALGVTRIVIAHRLSTIRHADRIYVIDQGRVVESGRFDELEAAGGLFSRLMARQAL